MLRYALFDIETRVDWELIEQAEGVSRERYLEELQERDPKNPRPFVPHVYHLPIAIALGFVDDLGNLGKVGSLLANEVGEGRNAEALARAFWEWLTRFQGDDRIDRGVIVSFNGRGFDLPVLELAALRYGIPIARHLGEKYGNRYRFQTDWHLDLLDYLTAYGASPRPAGGLSTLSVMCGLPPKDTDGSEVQALYDQGQLAKIDAYSRNDVRRTYVLFARLQYMRAHSPMLPKLPKLEAE